MSTLKRAENGGKIDGEELPVDWLELRLPNGNYVTVDSKRARQRFDWGNQIGQVWLVSRRCFMHLWSNANEVSRTEFSAKRIVVA